PRSEWARAGPKAKGIKGKPSSRRGTFRELVPPTTMRAQGGPSPRGPATMRLYNQPHATYCGAWLHARSMYLHVLDAQGQTRLDQNLPAALRTKAVPAV